MLACLAAVAGMGALSYAAVPLYRMFCQATGYGGTTQRAEKAPDVVLDRVITVRFDANVTPGMAWTFEPEQRTVDVKVGETTLAFYTATNTSDQPITGEATFNVSPDIAGSYFAKIECFCFKEQRLEAGQPVEMPVSFFVDPTIMKDRDATASRRSRFPTRSIRLPSRRAPRRRTASPVGGAEAWHCRPLAGLTEDG